MRVVIVGGGFAGVHAALQLANKKDFEVKLISNQNFFEYHAALYRSATGRSPLEVAIPLKEFFSFAKNIEVIEDEIVDLDSEAQKLTGSTNSKYHYDELILAMGNVTAYFGVKGLKEYAYGVKSINQALALKRHLHEQLLNSEDERNYVVIGAGATGVELSAELVSYMAKVRRKHKVRRRFTVDLIEAAPRPMAIMPEDFSEHIKKHLTKIGVRAMYGTQVKSETVDEIELPSGPIKSHTVIWTAGVTNNPFFAKFPKLFETGKAGRVTVDKFMRAASHIYIVGDSADTKYSGMAQTALYDAKFVASNIERLAAKKPLREYRPKKPIYAIPVGPRWAAVLWGKMRIYGKLGWMLRRLADLELYLRFLPFRKAMNTWKYGFEDEEVCPVCKN